MFRFLGCSANWMPLSLTIMDTLLISVDELTTAFGTPAPNGFSLIAVQKRLYINAATAAWLIENGYLELWRFRHNITRVTRDFVTAESFARFEKDYITPGRFAREHGIPAHTAGMLLRKSHLRQIYAVSGLRPIYWRADVAAAFSESEG